MEKKLEKFAGKRVKLILKNNFVYQNVVISINDKDLIEFADRDGNLITVASDFVAMISEVRE